MTDIGFGPLWRIDGPLPLAQERGLLNAAFAPAAGVRIVPDQDEKGIERWMNGVEVYPYPPDVPEVYRACGTGTDADQKGFGADYDLPQFEPMTLWVAGTCTTYRVGDHEDFKARLVAAFEARESAAIAKEFMGGLQLNEQPYLADGAGTFPLGDTATNPVNGLALLEEEIALSGSQGIIHVSPMLATALLGRGFALADKTGVIRTINGIVVIADFGYAAGATPIGHADPGATEEWAYATGPLDIRRTELFIMPTQTAQAVDRGTGAGASNGRPNSVTYRVEKYALVDWDTQVHANVLIDRCRVEC